MPLDHGLLAQVVRTLDNTGAKTIGLDVIFNRSTDKDELLINAIRGSKAPVVLGAKMLACSSSVRPASA
jgi:CHASE2 domain-containing sensor protein